ncbi:transposase [Nostoc sp.]|uniref:transposase n=1 Tax=Nostoc sp. TaxID=1180 RepID=UPI003FA5CC39
MNPSYPSNLTLEQWELLSGLIPQPKNGGRKRSVDMQAMSLDLPLLYVRAACRRQTLRKCVYVNAILYGDRIHIISLNKVL